LTKLHNIFKLLQVTVNRQGANSTNEKKMTRTVPYTLLNHTTSILAILKRVWST